MKARMEHKFIMREIEVREMETQELAGMQKMPKITIIIVMAMDVGQQK